MQLYGTRHPLPDLSPTTDPLGLRLISCLAVSAQSWVCLLTPGRVPVRRGRGHHCDPICRARFSGGTSGFVPNNAGDSSQTDSSPAWPVMTVPDFQGLDTAQEQCVPLSPFSTATTPIS